MTAARVSLCALASTRQIHVPKALEPKLIRMNTRACPTQARRYYIAQAIVDSTIPLIHTESVNRGITQRGEEEGEAKRGETLRKAEQTQKGPLIKLFLY